MLHTQRRDDFEPVDEWAGVVGADVVGAFSAAKISAARVAAPSTAVVGRPVTARRNDLRETEIRTGSPNACFSRSRPASTRSEASGRLLRKKPMPGSRISRSRAIPARSSTATRSAKKAWMRCHTSSADSSSPLRPAAAVHGVHDDEPATRGGQFGINGRVGETLDVVEESSPARDGEALHLGREAVDRHRRAVFRECREKWIEAADLLGGGDRLGVDVAGRAAEIDDLRSGRDQRPRLGQRRRAIEKPAAVGERIRR